MAETHQNGQGTVFVHRIHGEVVVMVGINGDRTSTREVITQPKQIHTEPSAFLDGLIARLPEGAVAPVHPLTPNVRYAGSPKNGYVMSVDPQYEGDLLRLINQSA